MKTSIKNKILKQKHANLLKLGLTLPKDSEENKMKAKEAHGY